MFIPNTDLNLYSPFGILPRIIHILRAKSTDGASVTLQRHTGCGRMHSTLTGADPFNIVQD